MVCRIAFIHRPNEPHYSGKYRSTKELVYGLNKIGVNAIHTNNLFIDADYYAVDSIDDLKLLPNVENSRKIVWIRRDVTKPITPRFEFESPGHLLASSQFVANEWLGYAVTVLPDAVRIPCFNLNIGLTQKRLLYVGRVCRSKGIPLLLKTLHHLEDYQWHLDIVGPVLEDFTPILKSLRLIDTSYSRKEKEDILLGKGYPSANKACVLDSPFRYAGPTSTVTFHGPLPYWRVSWLYQRSRVVIIPSQFEPFGRAVIEALAHGRPPIAIYGSGGPEEIIPHKDDRKYRFFFSDHSPVSLAASIRSIQYQIIHDEKFKSKLMEMVEPYRPESIAKRFVEIVGI